MSLTKNQTFALRAFRSAGHFHIPPECGGQTVEVGYAASEEYIYRRFLDQSDRTSTIVALCRPADGSPFDPWNGHPKLGRRVGTIYRGPHSDEPARVDEDADA